MEYPFVELNQTTKSNKMKLQRIQNKASRFINNVRLNDRISSRTLHDRSKLDPINVRFAKLTRKFLYKMKNIYDPDPDFEEVPYLNLNVDDYQMQGPPKKDPEIPTCRRVRDNIYYAGYERIPILYNLPQEYDDFVIPNPIYS